MMDAVERLGPGPSGAFVRLAVAIGGNARGVVELDGAGRIRGIAVGEDGNIGPSPLSTSDNLELSRIAGPLAERGTLFLHWARPSPVSMATLRWRDGGPGGSRVLGRGAIDFSAIPRRSIPRNVADVAFLAVALFVLANAVTGILDAASQAIAGTPEYQLFARTPWFAHPWWTTCVTGPILAAVTWFLVVSDV